MAYFVLGIGSNLSDPLIQLREAIKFLKQRDIEIVRYSSIYLSKALVPEGAPIEWNLPYLNAAILIKTSLQPHELLKILKQIETKMGRAEDHEFWSPRVIDIDILCSDYLTLSTIELTIPHKELLNRSFALKPLLDVLPNWQHPKFIELNLYEHLEKLEPVEKIQQLLSGPEIMGILNITPDSFSDNGIYSGSIKNTIHRFDQLFSSGAHMIDIGAESTSLKASNNPISSQTEWQRLEPVLESIKTYFEVQAIKPTISIDTYRIETIEKLINYDYVTVINDVMGTQLDQKAEILISNPHLKYIIMDNWRGPLAHIGINEHNDYDRVMAFAQYQIEYLLKKGVKLSQLIFDPGFGFAKPAQAVKNITNRIQCMKTVLNMPILIGHSRKQSVVNPVNMVPFNSNKLTNYDPTDLETSILSFHFIQMGADILRVHEVEFSHRAAIISSFYQ
ncbi:dihydropteroate synthase [Thiotrichales bacterium 19S3-7]|nr:dihydropteroate synthase [Thiotrichales bacterium 19S3-7]MCF6801855.1 dihydropteroate synthase [Thiotrichales bacterium 19S3-11]